MRLHDVTHQGKTQAAALGVVYQWIAHAIKLLENLLLLLRWDANSVIYHFQFHRSVLAIKIHSDVFPILRVFQGVVDQVDDGARHGLAIHSHRRNGIDLLFKGEAVLLDLITIGFQRVPYQFPHVGVTEVVFFAAGLDAREIQNIVDQCGKTLTLLANDAVVLLIFLLRIQAPHLERFGV